MLGRGAIVVVFVYFFLGLIWDNFFFQNNLQFGVIFTFFFPWINLRHFFLNNLQFWDYQIGSSSHFHLIHAHAMTQILQNKNNDNPNDLAFLIFLYLHAVIWLMFGIAGVLLQYKYKLFRNCITYVELKPGKALGWWSVSFVSVMGFKDSTYFRELVMWAILMANHMIFRILPDHFPSCSSS